MNRAKSSWFFAALLISIALAGCAGEDAAPTATLDTNAQGGKVASVENVKGLNPDHSTGSRAVVKSGALTVRVSDPEAAERKVDAYVSSKGGFVAKCESTDLADDHASIHMELRVPVSEFDAAIRAFEDLGARLSKKVTGEDVTGEVMDLTARAKIMRAQASAMRNLLAKSNRQSEMDDLRNRLMSLQGDIESLDARQKAVGGLAALSTFELTLVGEAKGLTAIDSKGWARESWNTATMLLGTVLRVLGTLAIYLLVFAPIWLPVGFFAWKGVRLSASRQI